MNAKKKFPYALIDILIDGWHHDKWFRDCCRQAAVLSQQHTEDYMAATHELFKCWVPDRLRVRQVLPRLSPKVNEMLWAGASTDKVRAHFRARLAGRNIRSLPALRVRARELDKSHDWKTVK